MNQKSWDFWEFLSENQKLTRTMVQFYQLRCGPPVDYSTGWDLTNLFHQEAIREQVRLHRPKVVGYAPRSWPWPLANRQDKRVRQYLQAKERRARTFLAEIVGEQVANNRSFFLVLPRGDRILEEESTADVRALSLGGDGQRTDMCAYGARDPSSGFPAKRTHLVLAPVQHSSSARTCPGAEKHPNHQSRASVLARTDARTTRMWCEGFHRALAIDVRNQTRGGQHDPKRVQRE